MQEWIKVTFITLQKTHNSRECADSQTTCLENYSLNKTQLGFPNNLGTSGFFRYKCFDSMISTYKTGKSLMFSQSRTYIWQGEKPSITRTYLAKISIKIYNKISLDMNRKKLKSFNIVEYWKSERLKQT